MGAMTPRFRPGDFVRLVYGDFAGMSAEVLSSDGRVTTIVLSANGWTSNVPTNALRKAEGKRMTRAAWELREGERNAAD